ncbi:uncharacterized protein LOC118718162 [Pipistrellus kuhlii]|uniref:uncharacterized protein LOC118718162 n=1 Tax=Pipistrellus kuhlii TaxID=59472 RepID=UPI00174F22D9|nr:uncharacterized protein LOC118718162 [Pipistrellus kuhlii]
MDRLLPNPDLVLFTDGSSFLNEGKRRAGYAVVSNFETIEAQALPEGWSAQTAELWALARTLELSKDKRANIYTDSGYAFATLHIYGAIYKESGLLTAGGKGIKNQNEILKLLEAVWEPKETAVIHCKGHQKGKDSVSEGNQLADATAEQAAKGQTAPAQIMLALELPEPPKYIPQEEEWAQQEGETAAHPSKPRDQVWVKDWKKEPFKPIWKGHYPVILTTPTDLKVAELNN